MVDASARGRLIARARRRRGLSQAALAGLVGRSESWLSQVERGLRQVDSYNVLTSLAEILRVDVAELTGEAPVDPQMSGYTAAREIERAMMAYDALESVISTDSAERPPDLERLRLGVQQVNRTYQAARYDEAGRMLPALIRSVEIAARTCPHRDSGAVSVVRAEIYQATTMVLSRVGDQSGVDSRGPGGECCRARGRWAVGSSVGVPARACICPAQAHYPRHVIW
jgi:transcriptional regulator with XRE-family HTH domain